MIIAKNLRLYISEFWADGYEYSGYTYEVLLLGTRLRGERKGNWGMVWGMLACVVWVGVVGRALR